MNAKKSPFYCSFCVKTEHETKYIVAGINVGICDECVSLCADIIDTKFHGMREALAADIGIPQEG